MTTAELIEMLTMIDPEGTKEVFVVAEGIQGRVYEVKDFEDGIILDAD